MSRIPNIETRGKTTMNHLIFSLGALFVRFVCFGGGDGAMLKKCLLVPLISQNDSSGLPIWTQISQLATSCFHLVPRQFSMGLRTCLVRCASPNKVHSKYYRFSLHEVCGSQRSSKHMDLVQLVWVWHSAPRSSQYIEKHQVAKEGTKDVG